MAYSALGTARLKQLPIVILLICCTCLPVYARTIVVESGDTLTSLARRAGVTIADLRLVNELTSDTLRPGQKLSVPSRILSYTVRPGDTLTGLARRQNSRVAWILALNNLPELELKIGQSLRIPVEDGPTALAARPAAAVKETPARVQRPATTVAHYRVRPGDTLTAIARRSHTSVAGLRELNPKGLDPLYAGQMIRVPGVIQAEARSEPKQVNTARKPYDTSRNPSGPGWADEELPDRYLFPVRRSLIASVHESARGATLTLSQPGEIFSMAGGVVEFAGPMLGYQSVVIVRTGKSLRTVYGLLENVSVEKGETVGAGTQIGRSGNPGSRDEAELYLEIRRGTDPRPLTEFFPFLKTSGFLAKK